MTGITQEQTQERFGLLLDAFVFSAPLHDGIVFGRDRVAALFGGTESIREVTTFPKSGGEYDPLTVAPVPTTAQQHREAGVDTKPWKEKVES